MRYTSVQNELEKLYYYPLVKIKSIQLEYIFINRYINFISIQTKLFVKIH